MADDREKIIELVGERAGRLFESGRMLCSEAVFCVANEVFHGGLNPETAERIASGLPEGIGGAGCVCGALTGGVLALGLLLNTGGSSGRKKARLASRELHDRFRAEVGVACCRTIRKKANGEPMAHFRQCVAITARTAAMTAEIILEKRPDLMARAGVSSSTYKISLPRRLLKFLRFHCNFEIFLAFGHALGFIWPA